MIKLIVIALAVILAIVVGYLVVNSVIEMFNGHSIGDSISISLYNIEHLFGLIGSKATAEVVEYPMTNKNITWETVKTVSW